MRDLDDKRLLERAQQGDRAAFGEVVRRHERRVYACAVRMMGTSDEAHDVVQDVFIRAYRAIARFDGRSALSTWLHRICVNVCLNRFRSGQRSRTVVDAELAAQARDALDDGDGARGDDPAEALDMRRMCQRLSVALDGLPASLRTAVVLVLMEGLAHKEAAEVLGCSEGTVSWRIHEARRRLWAALEAHATLPAAAAVRASEGGP